MFMRESEGIYQFGSRKVAVRVEQDRITVRVGGGYISVEEFLEQYTPLELEKQDRKDPLDKFKQRAQVQGTLASHGFLKREPSPNAALRISSP